MRSLLLAVLALIPAASFAEFGDARDDNNRLADALRKSRTCKVIFYPGAVSKDGREAPHTICTYSYEGLTLNVNLPAAPAPIGDITVESLLQKKKDTRVTVVFDPYRICFARVIEVKTLAAGKLQMAMVLIDARNGQVFATHEDPACDLP